MSGTKCRRCRVVVEGANPSSCPNCGVPWGRDPLDLDPILARLDAAGGDRRLGPVRIEESLGVGGMGSVYRGYHERLDLPVAIKCLHPRFAEHPEAVDLLQREARLAVKVRHDNLVKMFDVDRDQDINYIVMEFIDGRTLTELVSQQHPLAPKEVMRIFRGMVAGIAAAHAEGIVHRDIKPDNVMEAAGQIIVLDLGLAEATSGDRSNRIAGTPRYMAPEQIDPERTADLATDVYALGLVFCYLATGRPVFDGETRSEIFAKIEAGMPAVAELLPGYPGAVHRLIEKATAREPEDRFSSAIELEQALTRVLRAERRGRRDARGGPPTVDLGPPPTSRRGTVVVASVVVLLLIAVGGWAFFGDHDPRPVVRIDKLSKLRSALATADSPIRVVITKSIEGTHRMRDQHGFTLQGEPGVRWTAKGDRPCLTADGCRDLEIVGIEFAVGEGDDLEAPLVSLEDCADSAIGNCRFVNGQTGLYVENGSCRLRSVALTGGAVGALTHLAEVEVADSTFSNQTQYGLSVNAGSLTLIRTSIRRDAGDHRLPIGTPSSWLRATGGTVVRCQVDDLELEGFKEAIEADPDCTIPTWIITRTQ